MKPYKIKITSNDGQVVGVKMLTDLQYFAIRELFEDMTKNESPNASFLIEGNDIDFNVKKCSEDEYEMTEHGIKYIGETLGC